MSKEAGVLIDKNGGALFWHIPVMPEFAYIPDSPRLWDQMWRHRDLILGFAHSHPGRGIPHPSYEDLTTFAAVESALGSRLYWWITSMDEVVIVTWEGPNRLDYEVTPIVRPVGYPEPLWLKELRIVSYDLPYTYTEGATP